MTNEEIREKCNEMLEELIEDEGPTTFYRCYNLTKIGTKEEPPERYIQAPKRDWKKLCGDDIFKSDIRVLLENNLTLLDCYNGATEEYLFEISEENVDILSKYKELDADMRDYSVYMCKIGGKYYVDLSSYDIDSAKHNPYYSFKKYNINGKNIVLITTLESVYDSDCEEHYRDRVTEETFEIA